MDWMAFWRVGKRFFSRRRRSNRFFFISAISNHESIFFRFRYNGFVEGFGV